MSSEFGSELEFETLETSQGRFHIPLNPIQGNTTKMTSEVDDKSSKGNTTLQKLRQGLKGFGTNNGFSAPKPTLKSLNVPGFDFNRVSATVSSVATSYELQKFFERLNEEAGVTDEKDRDALAGAFVVYIIKNGLSARQTYKDGRMIFFGNSGEISVPAEIISRALGANGELRRIGNALADLQRAYLRADDEVQALVLNQVSGWASRPKYPDLVLESAVHCSGLSIDERKFVNYAKTRRLQYSQTPDAFVRTKDAEAMFDVNDVDIQNRNRSNVTK
jgi:hypothetical protein